jgi:hypothetical protein
MSVKYFAAISMSLLVSSCATNDRIPNMPKKESQELAQLLSSGNDSGEYSELKKVSKWFQPNNKVEPCELYFGKRVVDENDPTIWDPESRANINWDGDCKNGYAFGLGREFTETIENGLVSSLVYYGEVGQKPDAFYVAMYDTEQYTYIANREDGKRYSDGLRIYKNGSSVEDYFSFIRSIDLDGPTFIGQESVFKGQSFLIKKTRENNKLIVGLSSNPEDSHWRSISILKNDNEVFNITNYVNGYSEIARVENGKRELVKLDYDLDQAMIATINSINKELQSASDEINSSKQAMAMYKRKICDGNVSVDFMDNSIYGRVCLPNGDISHLDEQITRYRAEQERKWEQAEAKNLEQKRINQQRQQQIAQQRQQQIAQQRQKTNNAINNQSWKNWSSSQQPVKLNDVPNNWNNQSTTNCIVISNIVNCTSN